jgi:Glucose / Sorbosone dehydrogenase
MFKNVLRWLCVSSLVAGLAACGGGDPSPAEAEQREQASALGAATTWVLCANEGEVCRLPSAGNYTVLYGADSTSGRSTTRDFSNVSSVGCNNAVFGDPAFLVVKKCFYAVAAPPPPPPGSWTLCSTENGTCVLPGLGNYTILYGADATSGRSVTRSFQGVSSVECNNGVFGDPAFLIVKQCFYAVDAPPPPPPPPPSAWTPCGPENGTCVLPGVGNYTILYGADATSGRSVTRDFNNVSSVACNNGVFGDPAFLIVKQCFYRVADATPALVSPPIAPPALAADGTLLWPVPVEASPLALQVRPFATVPLATSGLAPRLNVLAHVNDRLFVADEKDGRIYEITGGRVSLWFDVAAAMLASTGRPLDALAGNVHSGLRSLAFHPQFASNGRFYTSLMEQRPANPAAHRYLSDVPNPIAADSVLVEWSANPATMVASPTSYREVFRVGVPVYDHPIKQILFRPGARAVDADYGLLYIAHGDGSVLSVTVGGGMANDARGKILRIDPLATATAPYSVPPSNPFVGSASMIPEVYSLGHRNPHHLAFARDGTLIAAEDGRDNIDEINIIQPGANHGWPVREGTLVHLAQGTLYDGVAALPAGDESFGYTYPAAQFLHQGVRGAIFTGQALGGGYVVENGSALNGHYFATDFVFTGDVFTTPLVALKSAVTKGPAAALKMAPLRKASVLFDHDANPATPPLALPTLLDMTRLAPSYDGSGRVDIRYGQGPRGELYLLSKRDRRVYLVTNSVP